ncbi:thioesterase, FlK family [Solicola sp. PLA-1-18]|uniref:thioesterase, FlK family n=1 Tax=Solicola sp. PLA-1-18 TaxID=3380532 RepID=UPI003B7D9E39
MAPHGMGSRAALALAVPLTQALGCHLIDPGSPQVGVALVPGELADNGAGGVHAAALAAALELAAYLAVAPTLGDSEHAVTHASSLQLIASVGLGERIECRAQLDRRGRRLAFLSVLAAVGDRPVARAAITKSIVQQVRSGS